MDNNFMTFDAAATWQILEGHVMDVLPTLPAGHFHCCVTSPPYFGLRDYGCAGQIGLEETPEEFIDSLVTVFGEVRRVLRDDGTLWLNMGDSFANDGKWGGHTSGKHVKALHGSPVGRTKKHTGYKPKDLMGMPWRLAFALQNDGWYLRSEIIWHKRAPMPESVTDRPTKAHEQVFLLTKKPKYFYDHVASAEPSTGRTGTAANFQRSSKESLIPGQTRVQHRVNREPTEDNGYRNMRSVWSLSPESFAGAHFATMPTELPRRCLLAGTSEKGCCSSCGAPWQRVLEKERVATRPGNNSKVNRASDDADSPYESHGGMIVGNRDPQRHTTTVNTVGWQPGCKCIDAESLSFPAQVPCRVLDPFSGAGTTAMVARRLGLHAVGVELNPEYAAMSRRRIFDDAPLLNGPYAEAG